MIGWRSNKAILTVAVELSAACGLPLPIENRPIAGISDLANTVALESATAAPLLW